MAVNDLTFNQLSTVLKEIVEQATGQKAQAIVDTSSFVSVAQTALKTGYDPLATAVSQVLSRTIFSIRPYSAKFRGLEASPIRWGNHVRKLQLVDIESENDDRFALVDGQSLDPYVVNKPEALQTNFYGANVIQHHTTIFRDQLDNAFSSPEEFGRFISMQMQNVTDVLTMERENTARAAVANFIGGKSLGDASNVVHLLTLYNTATGESFTPVTIKKPENYVPFMRWAYGLIKTLSGLLTERSLAYHINITDKPIMRHTPLRNQKIYLFTPEMNNIDASVLSTTFHNEFLKIADHEEVNFWQTLEDPKSVNVTASYMNASGAIVTGDASVDNIFGVIFDEEAIGYTPVNQWSAPSAFNPRGGYTNIFYHETVRYWNDFTENGLVLLLD